LHAPVLDHNVAHSQNIQVLLTTGSLAFCVSQKKVRLVVPRCGVTNESAGEVISAVRVKKLFRDAYSNH
jgi:hypothetical protein